MSVLPAFQETTILCEDVPLAAGPADGFELSLSCVPEDFRSSTRLKVTGGTPPYTVVTNQGQIAVIDVDIFEVRIANAVTTLFGGFVVTPGHTPSNPFATCTIVTDIGGGLTPADPGYDPLTMSVGGNSYAAVRLGLNNLSKGIFTECRHNCSFMMYDCLGRLGGQPLPAPPSATGAVVGDNFHIIDPNECPFSYANQFGVGYTGLGKGLGPCVDAHDYDLISLSQYPPVWYDDSFNTSVDFAECGHGSLNVDTNDGVEIAAAWASLGGPFLDVRHPQAIAKGCSPCQLVAGSNLTIIVTDATLVTVIITIPVA